jgi:superfamily I DNA and RNA helicase|tara:strand:+ start:163 stop:336 length:174 start_codon:yes stop_codon:yes gene_type:complete
MLTIISLCDFTGEWSRPYKEAGYDVLQVDLKHGQDVRLFERSITPAGFARAFFKANP